MTYKQSEIVLVPFPYSDLSSTKKRPALVISSNEFNQKSDDLICCLITTNPKPDKHSINIDEQNIQEGSLHFKSKIKPYRVFTIDSKLILKKLCKLKTEKFNETTPPEQP